MNFSKLICGMMLGLWVIGPKAQAQGDQAVYSDALQNEWQNWSWCQVDFNSAQSVHGGNRSVAVTIASAWQAIYLHRDSIDSSAFSKLSFWIHGGTTGGQRLQIQALLNGKAQTAINIPDLKANTWEQLTFTLEQLGVANQPGFDGFWLQDRAGKAHPVFYMDDIVLVSGTTPQPTNSVSTTILVDAAQNRTPISDLIYGVAFASGQQVADLNVPLNRMGGNAESRYNWKINAHNRAADFYFESIGDASTLPGAEADKFIQETKAAGAEAMLTVPILGWAPKLGPNRGKLASYSTLKYGPQTKTDSQWFPTAGNGISVTNNTPITWNDPNDANIPVDAMFQQEWIRHLTNKWGSADRGGVRYYFMDNEPSLWHSTHQDIHPVGAKMQEVRDKFLEYAATVKTVDPTAIIAGPEEWGWSGYFFSGYDQQWMPKHNWNSFPDRDANGGWEYLPWFLDQLRKEAQAANRRLLDVFTVHFYPQGGEYSSNVSTEMQLRRNRSTRSLWDTNYVDPTWINDRVKLVPRLKEWVTKYYPGTRIGITEYNWGAEDHINGATTQADILGIFGREGLDIANRWTTPAATTPTYKAIKMYRNYDGMKSTFGNTSVMTKVPDPDKVSAYAAVRSSDRALTLMVINKQLNAAASISVTLTNFSSTGTANVWQLTSANVIKQLEGVRLSGPQLTNTVPAQSITLFVLPTTASASRPPKLKLNRLTSESRAEFQVEGEIGQNYVIQRSFDLEHWTDLATNTLNTQSASFSIQMDGKIGFYRASLKGQ